MSAADLLRAAWSGIAGRASRSLLTGLAIAVGVAATVGLSGIAASNRAALLDHLDALGANLSVVEPGKDAAGRDVPLPDWSSETIARQPDVERVGVFRTAPQGVRVFRNDLIPQTNGNGIELKVASPGALDAVGASYASGRGLGEERLPLAVLGAQAAYRLGVREAGDRILIGNMWYGVVGVLDAMPQAASLDTAVVVPETWAAVQWPDNAEDIHAISAIYVRTKGSGTGDAADIDAVRRMLARAANPAGGSVTVTASADLSKARAAAGDSLSTLGLLIGAVALVVGGLGIANTMVVTVMDRRGEIGLRRALGATAGSIRLQFVVQAAMLSALGGLAGVVLGAATAWGSARLAGQPFALDWPMLPAVWAVAMLVGVVAGLRPADRAARMTPMEALRDE